MQASPPARPGTPEDADFKRAVFALGRRPFIIYLAFLNAFVPISTDLYLPALPQMMEIFQCPRLLAGLGLYAVASAICIGATHIFVLIAGRVLQAVGSGAVSAVSMAVVKDVFKGKDMENALIWMQIMTMLAPMFAPSLGSLLLRLTSWRGLFVILLFCSLLALFLLFFLRETLRDPSKGRGIASLKRIPVVLGDPGLRRLLFLFSLSVMPFMAYLTSSAFIYIKFYGLSEEQFSLFFAANAGVAMFGPLLYTRLFRNLSRRFFLSLVYSVMAASGISLFFVGDQGPFYFIVFYLPLTLFASASRPVGALLMMSQLDTDNGTVAALMGCCGLLCGGLSMIVCSLGFANPVLPVAGMATLVGLACLIFWNVLDSRKLYRIPH
jgi:DHA1 family bicyclomycin/chloramphenicol resistance-like MFS transporter